ncbi:expressed unknown protein [Seminavis robusta]|uniref:Uncharacterized protein n=1 Tax=Seminavis robusta TaxID=568900 RepID=A0A9N8DH33_9STRA|nr:expressed unknown protein [Seminavis robusta]|eukprot:Sro88_g046290.1 n/a (649) ;mRNA; r:4705-6651
MGSPTASPVAPPATTAAPLPAPHRNMFRRMRSSRNRAQGGVPLVIDNTDMPTKPRRTRASRTNNNGGTRELFNLKGFFRSQGNLGRKATPKDRGMLVRAASDRSGPLRRSTSTHFTRSTTHRSSAFLLEPEPFTMSAFLMPEELAAFENACEEVSSVAEQEEEAKEEVSPLDCCLDHEPVALVIDDDDYGNPIMGSSGTLSRGGSSITNHSLQSQRQQQQEFEEEERLSDCNNKPYPAASVVVVPEISFAMKKNKHEELGRIQFEFDTLAEARAKAARLQRPILCVEAEVPGDVTTGETTFSHPLIVEAAESLFVTVQQRPLQPQDDDDGRFFTNSSCRTRVRVLDDMAIDVLPPVERMTAALVVAAMVRGLESYRMRVPQYLRLLLEEEGGKLQVLSKTRVRNIQGKAIFGIFDANYAEVEFAGIDGVLATRSGSMVRQQVVQVTYDSRRLTYGALVRHALRNTGATMIYYETNDQRIAAQLEVQQFEEFRQTLQQRFMDDQQEEDIIPQPAIKVTEAFGNLRNAHHPKPALRKSILRFVPMTDLQATRANRLIHQNKFNEAMHLLSPRQGLIAMQSVRAHHNTNFHFHDVVDVPIALAWTELCGEDVEASEHDDSERCHYCVVGRTDSISSDDDDEEEPALYHSRN